MIQRLRARIFELSVLRLSWLKSIQKAVSLRRDFRRFNRQRWARASVRPTGLILMESSNRPSTLLTYSYLAHAINGSGSAKIQAFVPGIGGRSWVPRVLVFLLTGLAWKAFSGGGKIFKSFGAGRLLRPTVKIRHLLVARQIVRQFFKDTPTNRDVELISVRGVEVGEVLYDHYLRMNQVATIDVDSPAFRRFLRQSIEATLYWVELLGSGEVRAVVVNHNVYDAGVVARAAVSAGVPCFQAGAGRIVRLTPQNPRPWPDFTDFPAEFRKLSQREQTLGVELAKSRIQRRLGGEVGVDMHYSNVSGFAGSGEWEKRSTAGVPKVLVASHCFSDAPHVFGKNLFPDFYEWLNFLGELSLETNYHWYLRSHPDCFKSSLPILEEFATRYPSLELLPKGLSHHQLAEYGLAAVLTVYGTVGMEYPLLGIPVINASPNNPHSAYSFSYHPKDLVEYKNLVRSVVNLKAPGGEEKREVEEYYFMRHVHNSRSNFFNMDFKEARRKSEEAGLSGEVLVYQEFLEQFSLDNHYRTLSRLKKFISSDARFFPL